MSWMGKIDLRLVKKKKKKKNVKAREIPFKMLIASFGPTIN